MSEKTLLDEFAMAALPALVADANIRDRNDVHRIATTAYYIASVMLAESKQRQNPVQTTTRSKV